MIMSVLKFEDRTPRSLEEMHRYLKSTDNDKTVERQHEPEMDRTDRLTPGRLTHQRQKRRHGEHREHEETDIRDRRRRKWNVENRAVERPEEHPESPAGHTQSHQSSPTTLDAVIAPRCPPTDRSCGGSADELGDIVHQNRSSWAEQPGSGESDDRDNDAENQPRASRSELRHRRTHRCSRRHHRSSCSRHRCGRNVRGDECPYEPTRFGSGLLTGRTIRKARTPRRCIPLGSYAAASSISRSPLATG